MSSHIVASRHHAVTFDPDDWFPIAETVDAYDATTKRCHGCPFTGLTGLCVERARLLPYAEVGIIGGTDPTQRRQLSIGADLQGYDGVAA